MPYFVSTVYGTISMTLCALCGIDGFYERVIEWLGDSLIGWYADIVIGW